MNRKKLRRLIRIQYLLFEAADDDSEKEQENAEKLIATLEAFLESHKET